MGLEIVDTPNDVTRHLTRMSSTHTIIRYITRGAPNGEKHVKLPEVRAIKKAGKKLAIVHETWGDFAHAGRGGISAEDGRKDGAYARAIMPKLGAPAGACVYFAIDIDGTSAQLRNNVLPYFKAVSEAFADGEYTTGIYGPGWFCQAVKDAGYVTYTWLANAKGWKGYKAFLPNADLVQELPTHIAGGLDVDPNHAVSPEWGQFDPFSTDHEIIDGSTDPDVEPTPVRLGQSQGDSLGTTVTSIAGVAGAGGLFTEAKSLLRSKIAWITGGMGGTGVTTAVGSDPTASSLAMQLFSRPSVWLGLIFLAATAAGLYFYWRNHGKGALP